MKRKIDKQRCRRLYSIAFIVILIVQAVSQTMTYHVQAVSYREYSGDDLMEIAQEIINWKKVKRGVDKKDDLFSYPFVQNAGTDLGDWYAFGLGRWGYEDNYQVYLGMVSDTISRKYNTKDKMDAEKATEWHRVSLAVLAMGGNPASIGQDSDGHMINLVADGTYYRGKTADLDKQGINGYIWGLITLDALRYSVPEDAVDDRNSIITGIISQQLEDGGFAMVGQESDVDITAMAVQALAPYYNSEQVYTYTLERTGDTCQQTVRQVVDSALQVLSERQLEGGDYQSWGTDNVESTVQVMVALCCLGINPLLDVRFIKGENTLLDGIMKYKCVDGGFTHSFNVDKENTAAVPGESNSISSEQVLYALNALYRLQNGLRTLYDMREEMSAENTLLVQEAMAAIHDLNNESSHKQIEEAYNKYCKVPIEERSYVYNYYKLSDLMKNNNIENVSEWLEPAMNLYETGSGYVNKIFQDYQTGTVTFTAADVTTYLSIASSDSTEYYAVVKLLRERLQKAENREEYIEVLNDLNYKMQNMNEIQNKINQINEVIEQQWSSLSAVTVEEKGKLEEILESCKELSDYDKTKIEHYQEMKDRNQSLRYIMIRDISIFIGILFVVISIMILIVKKAGFYAESA